MTDTPERLSKEEFTNKVMRRLPDSYYNAEQASLEDILVMKNIVISELYDRGFSIKDASEYCRCMEEVSPNLDEKIACTRMDFYQKKYPRNPFSPIY